MSKTFPKKTQQKNVVQKSRAEKLLQKNRQNPRRREQSRKLKLPFAEISPSPGKRTARGVVRGVERKPRLLISRVVHLLSRHCC